MRTATITAESLAVGDKIRLSFGWGEVVEVNIPVCVEDDYGGPAGEWFCFKLASWAEVYVVKRNQLYLTQLTDLIPQESI